MNENIKEHYPHFLLEHADVLRDYVADNSEGYYEESTILGYIFTLGAEDYLGSTAKEVFNISLADVVADKWFLNKAIELYEEETIPEQTLYITFSLIEEVKIRARSVEEAIEKFHKDEAKYSKVAKQFGDSDDFNGIGAMTSGDGTL